MSEELWRERIRAAVARPELVTFALQPIVSVHNQQVAGYEALARFLVAGSDVQLGPDAWFDAAERLGLGPDLESAAIRGALLLRDTLPPNRFLSLNVSPHLVTHPSVVAAFGSEQLDCIVVELTERSRAADIGLLRTFRDEVAARGGFLALDDAGAGYSGLRRLTELRPHFLKLDRELVRHIDRDEIKRSLAELLGELAGRMDTWLLAEGVETWAEMEALAALRVPLVQGFLLGHGAPPWSTLDPSSRKRLATLVDHTPASHTIAPLIERAVLDAPHLGALALRVDDFGGPADLLLPCRSTPHPRRRAVYGDHEVVPVTLRLRQDDDLASAARRVVSRPDDVRFDPVVCVDEVGKAVGIVRVERILKQLAEAVGGAADGGAQRDVIADVTDTKGTR